MSETGSPKMISMVGSAFMVGDDPGTVIVSEVSHNIRASKSSSVGSSGLFLSFTGFRQRVALGQLKGLLFRESQLIVSKVNDIYVVISALTQHVSFEPGWKDGYVDLCVDMAALKEAGDSFEALLYMQAGDKPSELMDDSHEVVQQVLEFKRQERWKPFLLDLMMINSVVISPLDSMKKQFDDFDRILHEMTQPLSYNSSMRIIECASSTNIGNNPAMSSDKELLHSLCSTDVKHRQYFRKLSPDLQLTSHYYAKTMCSQNLLMDHNLDPFLTRKDKTNKEHLRVKFKDFPDDACHVSLPPCNVSHKDNVQKPVLTKIKEAAAGCLLIPLQQLRKLMIYAGSRVDTQIGAMIITIFGANTSSFVSTTVPDSSFPLSWLDYIKIGIPGLICVLMICSWMLKPTTRINHSLTATPTKNRREEMSHLMAGAAITCTSLAIFYTVFNQLPVPYAVTAVCSCMTLLLLALLYGSNSRTVEF